MFQGDDRKVIGARLSNLITEDDHVPPVLERLIKAVELHGLYTEGIYRKAGAASKIKQLIRQLNTGRHNIFKCHLY